MNLHDAESIAAWYRQHPQRHGPQIAAFARLWPQFAEAIKAAGLLIRLDATGKS